MHMHSYKTIRKISVAGTSSLRIDVLSPKSRTIGDARSASARLKDVKKNNITNSDISSSTDSTPRTCNGRRIDESEDDKYVPTYQYCPKSAGLDGDGVVLVEGCDEGKIKVIDQSEETHYLLKEKCMDTSLRDVCDMCQNTLMVLVGHACELLNFVTTLGRNMFTSEEGKCDITHNTLVKTGQRVHETSSFLEEKMNADQDDFVYQTPSAVKIPPEEDRMLKAPHRRCVGLSKNRRHRRCVGLSKNRRQLYTL